VTQSPWRITPPAMAPPARHGVPLLKPCISDEFWVRPGLGSPLRCAHSVSLAALVRDLLAAIGRLSASLRGRLHRSQRPELLLPTGTGSARPGYRRASRNCCSRTPASVSLAAHEVRACARLATKNRSADRERSFSTKGRCLLDGGIATVGAPPPLLLFHRAHPPVALG
jgi:hypothetical protein